MLRRRHTRAEWITLKCLKFILELLQLSSYLFIPSPPPAALPSPDRINSVILTLCLKKKFLLVPNSWSEFTHSYFKLRKLNTKPTPSLLVSSSLSSFPVPVSLCAGGIVSSYTPPLLHFHSFIYSNHLLCVFIVFPALIDYVWTLPLC